MSRHHPVSNLSHHSLALDPCAVSLACRQSPRDSSVARQLIDPPAHAFHVRRSATSQQSWSRLRVEDALCASTLVHAIM
jgi:hypothetical protein